MNSIKIYSNKDAFHSDSDFSITKMEDIYDKRNGKVDVPHRHEFYTVLVVKNAKGEHKIDFNSYPLHDHQIYFVSPGQVHQVVEREKSEGYVLTFTTQFLLTSSIPLSFIGDLNLFQDYGDSPPLLPDKLHFENLLMYSKHMLKLLEQKENMYQLSIGAYLKLFLINCNNACLITSDQIVDKIAVANLVRDFKIEVNKSFNHEHSTSFYADKLHITPDYLNRVVKAAIGKTAKEYIQSRIIIEAKRLMYFSPLSVKEIGFKLGFDEPGNFSAFFKKCTGQSPSLFIEKEA